MGILMLGYISIHLLASANVWLCCQFSYIFVAACQKLSVFLWGSKSQWILRPNKTVFHFYPFLLFLGRFRTWAQHSLSPHQNSTVISSTEASGRSKSSTEVATSGSQDCREWEKISVESCFDQLCLWQKDKR